MTKPNIETFNEQVLADTFYHLVRYALSKIKRDTDVLGVTESNFTVVAMGESLAANANAAIFGDHGEPTVARLLNKARQSSLSFCFFWHGAQNRVSLHAVFRISYEDGDLKVSLLLLSLPESIPISRDVGVINGHQPLEEAVFELLVVKNGRLSAYPAPA